MIGTLMMMGIVVSNSILLVDFANRMVRARGHSGDMPCWKLDVDASGRFS